MNIIYESLTKVTVCLQLTAKNLEMGREDWQTLTKKEKEAIIIVCHQNHVKPTFCLFGLYTEKQIEVMFNVLPLFISSGLFHLIELLQDTDWVEFLIHEILFLYFLQQGTRKSKTNLTNQGKRET